MKRENMAEIADLQVGMHVTVNMAGFDEGGVSIGAGAPMVAAIVQIDESDGTLVVETVGSVAGKNTFCVSPDRVTVQQ
jgi:hypothetical protein